MMLELLVEREFPVAALRLFASKRSAGMPIGWKGATIEVDCATRALFVRQTRQGMRDVREALETMRRERSSGPFNKGP